MAAMEDGAFLIDAEAVAAAAADSGTSAMVDDPGAGAASSGAAAPVAAAAADYGGAAGAAGAPRYPPVAHMGDEAWRHDERRVAVPAHRMTPLKAHWTEIYTPVVEHMRCQIRMNTKLRAIELRASPETATPGALQKCEDFCRAFLMGFEIQDAIALLRMDDLYVDSFDLKDVKTLRGDHLSRAVGRVAGRGGSTKFNIENSTRTRIVLADTRVHILGSFTSIKIARDAVVDLIRGSPPGKIFARLQRLSRRGADVL